MNFTYDLSKKPASWDFLQWLINARIQVGGKFGVHFDGEFRNDGMARPMDQRRAIFNNVMRPALSLIGATEVDEGIEGKFTYLVNLAVSAHKAHMRIPKWTIPTEVLQEVQHDLRGRRPLVITLREASYYPERNSNLDAWFRFAWDSGEDVIFVRDTARADEPLPSPGWCSGGFEISPKASKELLYRAALMSLAKCNLLVANGPVTLAWYLDAPWLCFSTIREDMPHYAPGQPSWWKKLGCPVGSQFPWSTPKQRFTWNRDTLENIQEAYENTIRSPQRQDRREASGDAHWAAGSL
jgi:hypothetical protein